MARFKKMMDFTGKVVVITGGAGLIGKEVSLAFLEHGASVVVADMDEKIFRGIFCDFLDSGKISFERFDITNPSGIGKGIKKIIGKFKKIDVWVNSAYPRTPDWGNYIDDVTFSSWDKNIRMQLGGYFWSSKLVLEYMKKKRSGCLINFGSTYGVVGPNFDIYKGTDMTMPVAYSAIKGAVVNLTRYLAALYGGHNIRVNCICPGGVFNGQNPGFVKRYGNLTPLKRMAKNTEMAMPTLFLASDAASYITGHVLMVDGGWCAW